MESRLIRSLVDNDIQTLSLAKNEVEVLKAYISGNNNDPKQVALRYYIGFMDYIILFKNKNLGAPLDKKVAKESLENYDIFIKFGLNIIGPDILLVNAYYQAGNVANLADGNADRAMIYWGKCADLKQPGCMNILAYELLEKPNSNDNDIKKALALHAEVVKTGIQARCAGIYSAEAMADIIHFTGVRRPGDDELEWLEEGKALFRQLQEKEKTKDTCDGASIGNKEFMIRRDRGESRVDLLDKVIDNTTVPHTREVAQYLEGAIDESQFESLAKAAPSNECRSHFFAAWRAKQNGDREALQRHYEAMAKFLPKSCRADAMYVRSMLSNAMPNG